MTEQNKQKMKLIRARLWQSSFNNAEIYRNTLEQRGVSGWQNPSAYADRCLVDFDARFGLPAQCDFKGCSLLKGHDGIHIIK